MEIKAITKLIKKPKEKNTSEISLKLNLLIATFKAYAKNNCCNGGQWAYWKWGNGS